MPDCECSQKERISRLENVIDGHLEVGSKKHEQLMATTALTMALSDRVEDHKNNPITGWSPKIDSLEKAVIEISKILAPVSEWVKEYRREKKWWEHQLVGVALQILIVFLLAWLGIKK